MTKNVNEKIRPNKPQRVTIAIPTFNRSKLLARAISSALAQNYFDIEIIVSDNCSTDNTREYLSRLCDLKLKILLQENNVGMAKNWDACLEMATGEYFLLLSDDDYFIDSNAIEKFVHCMSKHDNKTQHRVAISGVCLDGGRLKPSFANTKTQVLSSFEALSDALNGVLTVFPCATMLCTDDIRELGGYSASHAALAVDAYVWQSICLKTGGLIKIDEPLVYYMLHQSESARSVQVWERDLAILTYMIANLSVKYFTVQQHQVILKLINCATLRFPLSVIKRNWLYGRKYSTYDLLSDLWIYKSRIFKSVLAFYIPRYIGKIIK